MYAYGIQGKALWARGGPQNPILGTSENLRARTSEDIFLLGPPLALLLQFLPQCIQKNNGAQPCAMQRGLTMSPVILQ